MPTPKQALRFLLGAETIDAEPNTSTLEVNTLGLLAETLEKGLPLDPGTRAFIAARLRRIATVAVDYSAGGFTEEPSTGSARAPIPSHVVSALAELERVWNDPGQHVDYHEYQQRRLHERWASLERVILRLLKLRDGSVVGAAQVAKAGAFQLSEARKQLIESLDINGTPRFWKDAASLEFRTATLHRVIREGSEPASELAYAQQELDAYSNVEFGPFIDTVRGF